MSNTNEQRPYYLRDPNEGVADSTGHETITHIGVIAYGEGKTGKTLFSATFPRTIHLSFDRGELTLTARKIDAKRLTFYYGKKTYQYIISFLNDARDGTGPFASGGVKTPDGILDYSDRATVVIDTGTELARFLTYEIMAIEGLNLRGRGFVKYAPETAPPEREHYGLLLSRMGEIGRKLRDLKARMHWVMICHDMYSEEDNKGYPDVLGGTKKNLKAWPDEFYYFQKERVGPSSYQYIANTQGIGPYDAASRFGRTARLVNPSFSLILDEWEKAYPGITKDIVDRGTYSIGVNGENVTPKPQTPSAAVSGGTPPATPKL